MRTKTILLTSTKNALTKLGKDIKDARRRRKMTVQMMSDRSGVSKATICKIEAGNPAASIGKYFAVIAVFGMTSRLRELADGAYDKETRQLKEKRAKKPSLSEKVVYRISPKPRMLKKPLKAS